MPRKKRTDRPNRKVITIVSVSLEPGEKAKLDAASDQRGMTIKSLLGRLIEWFAQRDATEQAIILGQLEGSELRPIAELLAKRA